MDAMAEFNKGAIDTLHHLTFVQKVPEKLRLSFLEAVYFINSDMAVVGISETLGESLANELKYIAGGSVDETYSSRINSRIEAFAQGMTIECPDEHKEELAVLLNDLLQKTFGRHNWRAEVAVKPDTSSSLEVDAATVNHKFGHDFG
ncbi:MAG TPA: hypothetical protein DEA55_09960 [Rhodospirillaceae bacterium]|nr:hypothetical protein [Rhodospirillaceae bacterium]